MFPTEAVPDGNVMAPHHLYAGLLVAWFGFQYVWPRYPRIGAAMAGLGLAIATDDYLSHAFGVWTPLDSGWKTLKGWVGIK